MFKAGHRNHTTILTTGKGTRLFCDIEKSAQLQELYVYIKWVKKVPISDKIITHSLINTLSKERITMMGEGGSVTLKVLKVSLDLLLFILWCERRIFG